LDPDSILMSKLSIILIYLGLVLRRWIFIKTLIIILSIKQFYTSNTVQKKNGRSKKQNKDANNNTLMLCESFTSLSTFIFSYFSLNNQHIARGVVVGRVITRTYTSIEIIWFNLKFGAVCFLQSAFVFLKLIMNDVRRRKIHSQFLSRTAHASD